MKVHLKVMQMEDIDWNYWLDLTYIDEWKACGLSLGINPKRINRNFLRDSNFLSPEQVNQFINRLDIIQNNKYSNYFAYGHTEVLLEKFVRWAITKNSFKDMPTELLSLINPKENQTVKNKKIHLRDRKYTEFEDEKKKFETWGKCAEHYGISRQLYDSYRKFAKNRDNPIILSNQVISGKLRRN